MKYIIKWGAGFGCSYDIVEAKNKDDADLMAYEAWKDEVESNADYGAQEYTKELAEEYDLE